MENFENINAVVVASDWRYFGSSIGPDEGESILYTCQKSLETESPLIIFAQGGGMKCNYYCKSYANARTFWDYLKLKKGIPVIVVVDSVVAGSITASMLLPRFFFLKVKN